MMELRGNYRLLAAGILIWMLISLAGGLAWAEEVEGESSPEACEVLAIVGGIACVDQAGEAEVEFLHPTLFGEPRRYREGLDGAYPAGPLEVGEIVFYGVKHELLAFHRREKEIQGRWRLPAVILDLREREGGEGLEILLEARGTPEEAVLVRFEPGAPGVGLGAPWEWSGTMGPVHDVMWLQGVELLYEPGATPNPPALDSGAQEGLLARLEARLLVDKTNPYLELYRGEVLERLGRREESQEAYGQAAAHPWADWIDLLRIGMRLEYRGESEFAARAFERARESQIAAGVRGSNVTALVNGSFGALWFQDGMRKAQRSGDLEGMERIGEAMATLMPELEGAGAAWERLARSLEEAGEGERSAHWRNVAGAERPVEEKFFQAARGADLFVVLQFGALLALLVSGALLGLGRRRNFGKSTGKGEQGWMIYLPRFAWADLVWVFAILLALAVMPRFFAPQMQEMATLADAPSAVGGDGFAAPAAGLWLEGLARGEAQRELLAISEASRAAVEAGGLPPQQETATLLVQAVEDHVEAMEIRALSEVSASRGVFSDFQWLETLQLLELSGQGLILILIVLMMNLLIFGGLIQAAASLSAGIDRWAMILIVGAPRALGWLRVPTLTAFLVGAMALTPLWRVAQEATEQALVAYFGLGEAPGAHFAAPLPATMLIGVALAVHLVGVALQERSKG